MNFEVWSLVRGEWRFSEIDVVGFDGHAHLGADGVCNFADVLVAVTGERIDGPRETREPVPVARAPEVLDESLFGWLRAVLAEGGRRRRGR